MRKNFGLMVIVSGNAIGNTISNPRRGFTFFYFDLIPFINMNSSIPPSSMSKYKIFFKQPSNENENYE